MPQGDISILSELLPYLTENWRLVNFAQLVMLCTRCINNVTLDYVYCYVATVIELTLKKFCINDATELPAHLFKRDKDHDEEEERRKRSKE